MLPPARGWRRLLTDRGSMTVEMVVAVPGFLLLLLIIAMGATWVSSNDQVGAAASDAARAASLARTYPAAEQAAVQAADSDLTGRCTSTPSVAPPALVGGTSFANATEISVTVTCQVPVSVFRMLGITSATQAFTSQATAPLDPYVDRG